MVLYAADISKLAEPVSKSVQPKQRKKVAKETAAPIQPSQEAAPVKIKKPRKPKQKEIVVVEPVPEEPEEPEPEEPEPEQPVKAEPVKAEPVKAVQKKRKQPVKEEPLTPVSSPKKMKVVEKKQRKPRDPTVPPLWFEKYIQGVKKEEAMAKQEKVSAKQVKQEAQQVAQKSWENGLTRDRVANEVDSHMTRMYCNALFNRSYDFQSSLNCMTIKINEIKY